MDRTSTIPIDFNEYMCDRIEPIDGACAMWYVVDEGIVFDRRAIYREQAKSGWWVEMKMPHSGRWITTHRTPTIGWGGLREELTTNSTFWHFDRLIALAAAKDEANRRVDGLRERLSV